MYETERQDLVDKISLKGIYDISVLKAIGEVERHNFVPDAMKHHAYKDAALPIGYGQTISQPYTVAFMTQALRLKPGYKVLEIGTGSGYQAALLIKMGMDVYSIERNVDIIYRRFAYNTEIINETISCWRKNGNSRWKQIFTDFEDCYKD